MAADDRNGALLLGAGFRLDAADAAAFSALLVHPVASARSVGVADDDIVLAVDVLAPPRGLAALAQALGRALGVPVEVRPQTGTWIPLEPDQRARLGAARLGGTMLGRRVWDQSAGLTLRIGPLGPEMFDALLPEGVRHRALVAFVRARVGMDLAVTLELVPGAGRRPPELGQLRLGRDARLAGATDGPTRINL
jgi:type VI secretion system protein ImpH